MKGERKTPRFAFLLSLRLPFSFAPLMASQTFIWRLRFTYQFHPYEFTMEASTGDEARQLLREALSDYKTNEEYKTAHENDGVSTKIRMFQGPFVPRLSEVIEEGPSGKYWTNFDDLVNNATLIQEPHRKVRLTSALQG